MNDKYFLRCFYGGDAAILEFDSKTRKHKNMSLDFYKNGNYDTAGICYFIIIKKSKEPVFVGLYERDQKMFLCIEGNEYDLFDKAYSISLKRKIFTKEVMLMHNSNEVMSAKYKTMADIDDVFCYVMDVISSQPRKIIRQNIR